MPPTKNLMFRLGIEVSKKMEITVNYPVYLYIDVPAATATALSAGLASGRRLMACREPRGRPRLVPRPARAAPHDDRSGGEYATHIHVTIKYTQ